MHLWKIKHTTHKFLFANSIYFSPPTMNSSEQASKSHADTSTDTDFKLDRGTSSLYLPGKVLSAIANDRVSAVEDAGFNSWGRSRSLSNPNPPDPTPPKPVAKPRTVGRSRVILCDIAVAADFLDRVKRGLEGRGDRMDSLKKAYQQVIDRGPTRKVAVPPRKWREHLTALAYAYPNGSEVFQYLHGELLLAEQAKRPLKFAPIGLVGGPGVGKSVIAEAIAGLLRSPMHRVQVEISNHASALVGTELHWSSSGPGLLFQALVAGEYINPTILLDEIEKVPTRDDYPNLHKVLYSLLESASAKNFRDASLPDLALDASHVRWIATANSLIGVPEAIRSRMRFFQIPALSSAQAAQVLDTIDAALRTELKLRQWPALEGDVRAVLEKESPRRMRITLRAGYANALLRADRRVVLSDLPSAALETKPHPDASPDPRTEALLTLTNLAALRALQMYSRMASAQRMWEELNEPNPTIH